ncbi:MAG TPA: DUF6498-containing protein [Hyphomonadaceae bacterium]|nr:DUF6498-containing protein [Hyphomonadaceae bacterium]
MKKLVDPAYWARALSNPLVVVGLIVDLLPIYAVIAWGWNAVPLVMLYWMENVIIGVMTVPRMLLSGARLGIGGMIGGLLLSAFFAFHYGMFCFVHGIFLVAFASFSGGPGMASAPFMDIGGIFQFGLSSGPHIEWIIYALVAFQIFVFAVEFVWKGEWKRTNPGEEMGAPYGRIVLLHFGIFLGAGALFLLGQPMVGILALIVFRAVWGITSNSKRFDSERKASAPQPKPAPVSS